MTITLNGTTGITNDGGYTGDGIVFADTTPANTLVTTTGGNVGVGATDPGYRLEVASADTTAGYAIRVRGNATAQAGAIQFTNNPVTTETGYIRVTYAGLMSFSNKAYIDSSGNFGIGTSSPQGPLDVRGNGYFNSLRLNGSNTTDTVFQSTGDLGIAAASASNILLRTNNSERARITSGGNWLVGTTSTFDVTAGAITQLSGQCAVYNTGSPNTLMSFYNSSQSARVGFIGSSGNSTQYNSGSDYRLKDNVTNMSGALSKLLTLRPVTFTWKVSPEVGVVSGFIAHELDEVVPESVSGEKDAMCSDGVTPNYQMVDQSKLVPLLTAAIQEQQAIITALTARVEALESQP
jgi:hypothetical protein